jgi:hypothetical protein
VFTARYEQSPYINRLPFVFKGLMYHFKCNCNTDCIRMVLS